MLVAKLTVCYHIMGPECVINTITCNLETVCSLYQQDLYLWLKMVWRSGTWTNKVSKLLPTSPL